MEVFKKLRFKGIFDLHNRFHDEFALIKERADALSVIKCQSVYDIFRETGNRLDDLAPFCRRTLTFFSDLNEGRDEGNCGISMEQRNSAARGLLSMADATASTKSQLDCLAGRLREELRQGRGDDFTMEFVSTIINDLESDPGKNCQDEIENWTVEDYPSNYDRLEDLAKIARAAIETIDQLNKLFILSSVD